MQDPYAPYTSLLLGDMNREVNLNKKYAWTCIFKLIKSHTTPPIDAGNSNTKLIHIKARVIIKIPKHIDGK